ncbi:hypothetical protein GQ44DRAFT_699218 [Phaeosphaeriaceae sp. PMI808]|nr:hypothetical protein GQ44DRAFT_699218 [Phaeosphaeriaceae sp. PMI808]
MHYNLAESLHGLFRTSPKASHNMAVPAVRVIVDGDSDKVYKRGEKVTGRVILAVEEEQKIESLKIVFAGNCITKTSRPFHVNGGENLPSRREFEEKIRLFNQEKIVIPETFLTPKKYTWTFEFIFPESTEPRYKRLAHGANYLKEPHPLPPTFQLKTNVPGGAAQISYFVQARLTVAGSREVKRCRIVLPYHPTPGVDQPRDARCTSVVLYGQTWKPSKGVGYDAQKVVTKVLSKVLRPSSNSPRIIPSMLYPERIAPGQHIPIAISLHNARDAINESQEGCIIDSLSISISTYSTTMCGHSVTQPEDVVSKHVTCIAKSNMNQSVSFNSTVDLTYSFRLIDDIECVPTFKTYTITRRYALGISVGIKYGNQHFMVRSSTPLEIVPRVRRNILPPTLEDEDIDPLPLYAPREPSKEFAPDYESIFALSRALPSSNSLAPTYSRGSSFLPSVSESSTLSIGMSTPASEIELLF